MCDLVAIQDMEMYLNIWTIISLGFPRKRAEMSKLQIGYSRTLHVPTSSTDL